MATHVHRLISVGVRELHNRTSELMRAVEQGAELEITRHGRVIGQLRAPADDSLYERLVADGMITPAAKPESNWTPDPVELDHAATVSDLVAEQRGG